MIQKQHLVYAPVTATPPTLFFLDVLKFDLEPHLDPRRMLEGRTSIVPPRRYIESAVVGMLQEVAEKKTYIDFPAFASSEPGDDSLSSANLWNSLSESIL